MFFKKFIKRKKEDLFFLDVIISKNKEIRKKEYKNEDKYDSLWKKDKKKEKE